MCGDEAVPKIFKGDNLTITLNNQKVDIDLLNLVSYSSSMYGCRDTSRVNNNSSFDLFLTTDFRKSHAKTRAYKELYRQLSLSCITR